MSREYFSKIAPEWDAIRSGYFSESLRDKAVALAGIKPGETAADIGAGTGFMTEGLLRAGLSVIAVDESGEMLDQAKKKLGSNPLLSLRQGSATRIPIQDGTANYAFANMLLHHVEKPRSALSEMKRILVPGGLLVLTDLCPHTFEFLKTEQHDRWMGFEGRQVAGWLLAEGFAEVSVEDLQETCTSKSESGLSGSVGIFAAIARKPAKKAIK